MLSKHSCHRATPQTPRVCPAKFSSGSGQFDTTELYTVENGNFFPYVYFSQLRNSGFFSLEVRLHSISLKGTLGKSVWSTSILIPASGQKASDGKVQS